MTFPIENQEQLNAIIGDRVARARASAETKILTQLGANSVEDAATEIEGLRSTITELEKLKEKANGFDDLQSKLTEAEKEVARIADLEAALQTYKEKELTDTRSAKVKEFIEAKKLKLVKGGENRLQEVLLKGEFDEENKLTNGDDLLKQLQENEAYLFDASRLDSAGSDDEGGKNPPKNLAETIAEKLANRYN